MGRPSKLTEHKWEEIGKRFRNGEKVADLAKEFKISKRQIYDRFSSLNAEIKETANQILKIENKLKALPVSAQIAVISLADELRAISTNLVGAARHGSVTAIRMAAIASKQTENINEENPMESQEQLQAISALTKISNDASSLGINLLTINKDKMTEQTATRKLINFTRAAISGN